jgi:hypothetical protein
MFLVRAVRNMASRDAVKSFHAPLTLLTLTSGKPAANSCASYSALPGSAAHWTFTDNALASSTDNGRDFPKSSIYMTPSDFNARRQAENSRARSGICRKHRNEMIAS